MLLLFGDACYDFHASIADLHRRSQCSVVLRGFLLACSDALRCGLAELDGAERARFGSFESLLELAEVHSQRRDESQDAAVATVLQCACQLGWLVIHWEGTTSGPTVADPRPSTCTGISTGMLAAAVAASASSVVDLVAIAPDAIRIALRLGIQASRRSRSLEPPSKHLLPWAVQYAHHHDAHHHAGRPCLEPNLSLRDELDAFHHAAAIAPHRRLYVSASGLGTTTVSGPPSVLQLFLDSSAHSARSARSALPAPCPVPARTAWHAPHLAPPQARLVDAILGTSPLLLHRPLPAHRLLLLPPSPLPLPRPVPSSGPQTTTVRHVLERVVVDLLSVPVDLDAVAHALKPFQPVPIGPLGDHLLAPLTSFLQANDRPVAALHAPPPPAPQKPRSSDIAIVGLAGRFPGGNDLDSFWDVLSGGLDLHREVPPTRFDLASHYDPTGHLKNSTSVPYGCFIDDPDLFDARLFNMSPREAAQTDPMARIFLMTVHEALEMSGYQYDRTHATDHRRIAVYFGQTSDDYREVNMGQNVDTFWVTGGNRMFANGRVNYHYGWEGPSMNVDGACSSSHMAIQLACSALASRECDTAVAGGGMVITNPDSYAGLDRGGFLSHTGPCKPFDEQADGYCRAEAVGTLVLKRLEDAIADRDNIQAVIKGISTNHSAEARSITHPHAETQEKLIRKVLRDAGVQPCDVDHVEMHGTGTQAGDLQETTSIASVFGSNRDASKPLYVGALKANVGHSESASGVSAVIKSILMLQKDTIPQHVGIKTALNPKLPALKSMNIHIPTVNTPFRPSNSQDGKRRMMVNNFNAAGGNTCLLLEDMPRVMATGSDPRTTQVVTVSARTSKSLAQNLRNMVKYLENHGDVRLSDLAYTTTARRMHHSLRTAHVASSVAELTASLNKAIGQSNLLNATKAPSVVFTFTGQGSLFAGMGHQLYATSSSFRESIQSSDSICRHLGFSSFLDLIKEPNLAAHQFTTVQAQLGQVALELALASAWTSWGVKPTTVIGHSLGEYVALCLAGVLSTTDMFFLVGNRALLMQKNCQHGTHSMLAVAMNEYDARQAIIEAGLLSCEIACLNGPKSTTVAGLVTELNSLHENLRHRNIKSTILDVPYANHSAQVQDIAAEYELIARQVHYGKPQLDVVSTLLGQTIRESGVFGAQYLTRQAREPVNFLGAVKQHHDSASKETIWVEIGPRPTCLAMVRSITEVSPSKLIPSMRPMEDQWSTLSTGLAEAYRHGVNVDWNQFHKEYETSLNLLDLPKYAFDLKSYWIQYEGDWNRTKSSSTKAAQVPVPPFSSTTLQRIESETSSGRQRTVIFNSNLDEVNLRAAIKGHLVNDWALCPSSVYADMAYTAATYIWKQSHPNQEVPGLNVSAMCIHSPIVLQDETEQQVRITAVYDETSSMVQVTYGLSSTNEPSAECSVLFEDSKQWALNWKEQSYFVRSVADQLTVQGVDHGTTERIFRKTAYRIFSRLVDYAPAYQGMQEVFLDGDSLEGYAKIKLQPKPSDATFGINPYWIDSLGHISGFVVNASSDRDQVYISEGFESMRLCSPLSEANTYCAYVRMLPTGKPGWVSGNLYILQDSNIVGVFQGVKFRAMKKKILEMVMQSKPGKHTNNPTGQYAPASRAQSDTSFVAPKPDVLPASTPIDDIVAVVDSCLCSETGVDKGEIADTTLLADIGIDSLLTLSLLATLRERADLSISTSDFTTFDTVGDLRQYVRKVTFTPAATGVNTPSLPPSFIAGDATLATQRITVPYPGPGLAISMPAAAPSNILQSVIASELGLDDEELRADEFLEEFGLDSLMTMAVLHAFREKTGKDLPTSFFIEHPTLASAKRALDYAPSLPAPAANALPAPTPPTLRATSIELQNMLNTTNQSVRTLFLLPDGSGSASSYLNLRLPPNIRVVALNSPFLRNPDAFPPDLRSVAQLFVNEILAQQPNGDYLLGGWSMGAAYAYEAANLLVTMKKHVKGLVMIDPCPLNRRPMNAQTLVVLEQIGVFNEIARMNAATQSIVRRHFEASTKVLADYKPEPRRADFTVLVITARDGVLQRLRHSEAQEVWQRYRQECGDDEAWLLLSREGDSTHGWAKIFGSIVQTDIGGDHFSIMKDGQVQALNERLGNFCIAAN